MTYNVSTTTRLPSEHIILFRKWEWGWSVCADDKSYEDMADLILAPGGMAARTTYQRVLFHKQRILEEMK